MREIVFQSEFGDWRVTICDPPADLAPFVESFWETNGFVSYAYEKLLPSGAVEFMVNLGPPQVVLNSPADKHPVTFSRAWLSGIQDAPLFTAPAQGSDGFTTHFVSASLKPEGVCELLGVDAFETARRVIDAEDLIGSCVRSLRDRMGDACDVASRFTLLADYLREQRRLRHRPASSTAVWAMQRTQALRGNLRIDDLCQELGVSRKHLNTLYRSSTGLSPKMFARLTRFRSVLDVIQGATQPWVDVALNRGFFDQAHLIRDFRQFAEETPNSFLINRAPDGESVNFEVRPE